MTTRGKSYEGVAPDGSNATGQRRVALVIGNAKYSHAGILRNPGNDAIAMEQSLRALGFDVIGGARDGIDLGYGALAALIRDFGRQIRQTSPDVALLFYAGHGLQADGRNYLMPVDAALEMESDVGSELYELQFILNQMEHRSRTSLVFLDACRNNPLVQNLARAMGLDDGARDARLGEGLAEQKVAAGTLIAYATQPGHIAYDGKGDNGFLTEALLAEMRKQPERDIELLLRDVRVSVLNATKGMARGPQVPWVHTSLLGPFAFVAQELSQQVKPAAETTATTPAHGTLEWSQVQWESLKDSTNIARLERFTDHAHPYYAGEANDLIEALKSQSVQQKAEAEKRTEEDSNWAWARQENTADAYRRFINAWPGGRFSAEAGQRINALAEAERQREADERAPLEAVENEKEREAKALTERHRAEGRIHITAPIIQGAPKDDTGGWFKPGNGKAEWFKDLDAGPEMVVVPAGKFMMGSPKDEPERESWQKDTESPQHEVIIAKPFAVSRCAITFDEWDAYVADVTNDGDKAYKPKDEGWGRGRRPVIYVSWDDARSYIAWLSDKAGHPYRLLSEAEWEYVARAGTTTPFWWGKSITPEQANYDGNYTYKGGGVEGKYREKTVPVDSFDSNPWGLYNVHGNVWEWCQDVWHDSYKGAPVNGSAWLEDGDKGRRVVRGGSWSIIPRILRSANRSRFTSDFRNYYVRVPFGQNVKSLIFNSLLLVSSARSAAGFFYLPKSKAEKI